MRVRLTLPKRRTVTTKNPTGKNWSEHKPDLKQDFHACCGYCGSYDGFRHTYFEVDHFVPKSLFEKSNRITYCQYDNLVYSCKFCNNNKSSKWPTKDETKHHENNEGFIDPCDPTYDDHLYRTKDGGIGWKTELGKWMAVKAFKFDERSSSIKVLWNLNRIRQLINDLVDQLNLEVPGTPEYDLIKSKASELSFEYFIYDKKLMEYYDE